jgi:hypothetical protein
MEAAMAEAQTGGGNGFLYFIVGALLVVVIGLGVMMYNGGAIGQSPTDRAIENSAEAVGAAADSVSKGVNDATR